jgi:hypothetical protein
VLNPVFSGALPRFADNDIAVRIIALFELFPELAGFTVEERSAEPGSPVSVDNVRFLGSVRDDKRAEIIRGLRAGLEGFLRELPETRDLLSGRTFNRTLHQLLDTRGLRAQGEQV